MSSHNQNHQIDPLATNSYGMTITPKKYQSNQQRQHQQRKVNMTTSVQSLQQRGIANTSLSTNNNSSSNSSSNSNSSNNSNNRKLSSSLHKESTKVGSIDFQSQLVQQHIQKYLHPQPSSHFKNSIAPTTANNTNTTAYMNSAINHHHHVNTATTNNAGSSARVQQNHVNSNSKLTNGIHQNHLQKGRIISATNATIGDVKPARIRVEDSEERSATPDSTTEPPSPRLPKATFKQGDDVLFHTDDGSYIFGTVGTTHGHTVQILFGDGTQEWVPSRRVKKLSCSAKDDEETDNNTNNNAATTNFKEKPSNKQIKSGSGSTSSGSVSGIADQSGSSNNVALNSEEVTCGSCGVVKRVAGKKALTYAPHTSHQFNCRRCLNKSGFTKTNMPSILIPQSSGRGRTNQTSSSPTKSSVDHHKGSGESSCGRSDLCFHCEGKTTYNDRLHCNLCERACHLSCLAITPTPLEGDRFWDVICSACGTQNGESGSAGRTKVFSCRRSITSWSDVAHLVLSCLGSQNSGERFFDLDLHVIPFIDKHLDCLHLPRQYKNSPTENRKMYLSTALNNAKLRFLNGKDVNRKHTLWAIRDNNNHQGYPLRLPNNNNNINTNNSSSSSSTISKGANYKLPPSSSSNSNVSNSKYHTATNSLKVRPNSAFVTSGSSTSNTIEANYSKISPFLNANVSKTGRNSDISEVIPLSSSPIRSCNVSSTQHESGYLSEGCSRTLGKSGKEVGSPVAKKSPTTRGANVSPKTPTKLLTSALAQSQSGRLIMKAKRTIATINIAAAAGKADIEEEPVMLDEEDEKSLESGKSTGSPESEMEVSSDGESEEGQLGSNKISNIGRQINRNKRKLSPEPVDSNIASNTATNSPNKDGSITNKKPKISPDLQITPVKLLKSSDSDFRSGMIRSSVVISPIADKMSDIFKTLNGSTGLDITKASCKIKTPDKDVKIGSPKVPSSPKSPVVKQIALGKAVKSASVTSGIHVLGKPSLRVRKPKVVLEVGTKKDKDNAEGSGAVKKTGVAANKKVLIAKGRGRGRPLKGANGVSNAPGTSTNPGSESSNNKVPADAEFSAWKSTVEDLTLHGEGYTIHCLPTVPESPSEIETIIHKIFKDEEKSGPPSFWKDKTGALPKPWHKSKKDFSDLDSFEITGRMVDESGKTFYHYEWKNGYSDSDSETEPLYDFESEVDNPFKLFEKLATMELENPSRTISDDKIDVIHGRNKVFDLDNTEEVEILEEEEPSIKLEFANGKTIKSPSNGKGNDSFLVSGLGLKRMSSNHPVTNYVSDENVIDLTSDSP